VGDFAGPAGRTRLANLDKWRVSTAPRGEPPSFARRGPSREGLENPSRVSGLVSNAAAIWSGIDACRCGATESSIRAWSAGCRASRPRRPSPQRDRMTAPAHLRSASALRWRWADRGCAGIGRLRRSMLQPRLIDHQGLVAEDDSPLDHVLQLADVAGPVVGREQIDCLSGSRSRSSSPLSSHTDGSNTRQAGGCLRLGRAAAAPLSERR